MVQVLTDNKTRTVSEIRNIFEKYGSSLGAPGCVSWMFEHKGLITLSADGIEEENIFLAALDAGADDVNLSGDFYEIYTARAAMQTVRKALEEAGFKIESSQISHVPTSSVKVDDQEARKVLSLMNALEEHDDVQNVFANFEIPTELIEQLV